MKITCTVHHKHRPELSNNYKWGQSLMLLITWAKFKSAISIHPWGFKVVLAIVSVILAPTCSMHESIAL